MELRPYSQPSPVPTRQIPQHQSISSPKLEAVKMFRQDSGYSDNNHSASSSRRTSTSSRHTSSHKSPRSTTASLTTSTRPSTKRTHKSSSSQTATVPARVSLSGRRPSLSQRHTTPQYHFYHFPTLPEPQPEIDHEIVATPPPPPPTVQYWTSDSTRRLEYAAIDAAGKGIKGFFIKLVPDCILPPATRRPRFHDDDDTDDAASVRRYRLVLPEEKNGVVGMQCIEGQSRARPGILRRWTTFSRRR